MKQIIFTLCVFIALAFVDNAAAFYDCVDSQGNSIITDNPPPGAKCKSMGGDDESMPDEQEQMLSKTGRLTQKEERKLEDLYNRAMSKSEKSKYVAGSLSMLCLAEVISAVKSKGKSVNPKFWSSVEGAFNSEYVAGCYSNTQRAAAIQSIDTSNISSCTSTMLQAMPRR